MYCILNMGWTPSQYIELNHKERAFVAACILTKLDNEKKHQQELKNQQMAAKNIRRRR